MGAASCLGPEPSCRCRAAARRAAGILQEPAETAVRLRSDPRRLDRQAEELRRAGHEDARGHGRHARLHQHRLGRCRADQGPVGFRVPRLPGGHRTEEQSRSDGPDGRHARLGPARGGQRQTARRTPLSARRRTQRRVRRLLQAGCQSLPREDQVLSLLERAQRLLLGQGRVQPTAMVTPFTPSGSRSGTRP